MSVTMEGIAKAAGVSVATVGRVLHNSGYVSAQARARVEQAVRALGYIPNQNARALKSRRSGLIGNLVMQNLNGLSYRITNSVLRAAERRGYQLVTMQSAELGKDEFRAVQSFISLGVEGLVITSDPLVPETCFAMLKQAGIPAVAVERGYLEQGIDSLTVADFAGVYDAVLRIVQKGHRRIALVASAVEHSVEKERLEGYRAALRDSGLPEDPALMELVPDYTAAFGQRAAARLFSLADPPTAVFCGADTLAAGVLQLLMKQRLRVPEDVSVVGYDDVLSRLFAPPIDSVALALEGTGEQVMELLLRRMQQPDAPVMQKNIGTLYQDRGTVLMKHRDHSLEGGKQHE